MNTFKILQNKNDYNHCKKNSLLGTLKFVNSLWLAFPAELVDLLGAHEMQQMNEPEIVGMSACVGISGWPDTVVHAQ